MQRIRAFQVACTYVGTVVGAGFASGQEIFHFFGRFGLWGYVGIAVSVFLFAWLGYQMMYLGHRLQAQSFRDVSRYLFGPWLGDALNAIMMLMLFGVTVAMLAGAGELFWERMRLPVDIGIAVTVVVTFVTLLFGINGILKANSVIVPVMISFVLFAFLRTLMLPQSIYNSYHAAMFIQTPHLVLAGISAVIYGALNVGLAAGVLIPLGAGMNDVAILRTGARWGAAALGFMLVAVTFTLFVHYPRAISFAVPMGYVATTLGSTMQWLFVAVLWGEIYSTLVGNVYAMTTQIPNSSKLVSALFAVLILAVGFLFSQVGFTALIAYGYTAFGYVSILILLVLLWPRKELP